METKKILFKAAHLLDKLETEDEEIKQEIILLKARTRGLLHLALQGLELAARMGLQNLGEDIDELLQRMAEKKIESGQ